MHFIGRGAEAILYKKNSYLVKKRIKKGYRIKEIDEKLRKQRTIKETNLMTKARRNHANVPVIIEKDMEEFKIVMEFIDGEIIKNCLEKLDKKKLNFVCKEIGENITKLHFAGIIHGDLTTSNMIIKNGKLYIVDFGLGKFSKRIEDYAIELHLVKRALISKHNKLGEEVFEKIIKNYNIKEKEKVLERLEKIQKRGRYS